MTIKRISIDSIKAAMDAGTTVLVPNNRLRDAVLDAYADSQEKKVFATPKVLGVDVWARNTWIEAASQGIRPFSEKLTISAVEELLLWTGLIEASLDRYPLLNEEETASAVSRAYQLMKQWQLQELHSDTLASYQSIPDISAFLGWADEFEETCNDKQLISLVDCIASICLHLEQSHEQAFPLDTKILLLNFYQPPPLYERLFSLLRKSCTITEVQLASEDSKVEGKHFRFPTLRAEFQHVAQWASEIVRQDDTAHVGLIGELNDAQRSELERILSAVLDRNRVIDFCTAQTVFNSTHDANNLMDEGLVHDAFLLFNSFRHEQSAEEFCRLLRSPFVLPHSNEWENRYALERELRKRINLRCNMQDILWHAGREGKAQHCPELHRTLQELRVQYMRFPNLNSTRAWQLAFQNILESFGWPGSQLSPHQVQVLERFRACLETLGTLDPILGPVDQSKAMRCLRRLCINSRHNQDFDRHRQISLYSIEEASGLDFDHIWLLNFNDQVWPPPINPSPFLPYSLQKEAGIPGSHSSVQYQYARDTFQILCQSVSATVQSSHHRSDSEQEYRASSFSKLFSIGKLDPDLNPTPHCFYGDKFIESPGLTQAFDEEAVGLLPSDQSLGGQNILSDQSSCPFRAFALYRLGANALEKFNTGLSPMARGSAIHEALEYLFKQLSDSQALHESTDKQLDEFCETAASTAIAYLRSHHKSLMTPRFEQIEQQRITTLLRRFVDREKEREPFTAVAWEQKYQWHYKDMLFHLKVDRLDRLADNSLAVIDYKTGKTSASLNSWLQDRPEDLQLPFYATLMRHSSDQAVNTVAIAHVNAEKVSYSGIMESTQFHSVLTNVSDKQPQDKDWDELMQHFETTLYGIADEFHAGIARVDPVNPPGTCRYCQLQALCRIQEQIDLTVETEDDDSGFVS